MSEMAIIRDTAKYSAHDKPVWRWSMVIDGETVSELWVDPANGEIAQVETDPAHQGNGYATALYRQAETEIEIFHCEHRTPEGERWVRAVGGPVLPCWRECCTRVPDFD